MPPDAGRGSPARWFLDQDLYRNSGECWFEIEQRENEMPLITQAHLPLLHHHCLWRNSGICLTAGQELPSLLDVFSHELTGQFRT